jgi:SAM-dependent methyltransferase
MAQPYDDNFFDTLPESARPSAEILVPLVMQMVHPASVIDVGCGTGTWLAVFAENGVKDILGVDGDYVNRAMLHIPQDKFIASNLSQPFRIERRFDLAMSLEVAEHLSPECAETFIDTLTGLAPVVLFSAAIPYQGGVAHLNEQWPEWWAKLFRARGFVTVDCLRRKLWKDERPDFWYAQNSFIAVHETCLQAFPILKQEYELGNNAVLPLVSPFVMENLSFSFDPQKVNVAKAWHLLCQVAKNGVKRRLSKKRPVKGRKSSL